MVVYCTGSTPRTIPPPRETTPISLETALSPPQLQETLSFSPANADSTISGEIPFVVGVVGASHSAILVLKNLATLAEYRSGRRHAGSMLALRLGAHLGRPNVRVGLRVPASAQPIAVKPTYKPGSSQHRNRLKRLDLERLSATLGT